MKVWMILAPLMTSVPALAWENPYACGPEQTAQCWIRCFNSRSILEGERAYRIWITPEKNGKAEYLVLRERTFVAGLRTASAGQVSRQGDRAPLAIDLDLDGNGRRVKLKASIDPAQITPNNGWTLRGTMTYAGKSMEVLCGYDTRTWMEEYNRVYDPSFPADLYQRFYGP